MYGQSQVERSLRPLLVFQKLLEKKVLILIYFFERYEELDHEMEISVWDKDVGSKDDFMGRVKIDLRHFAPEVTHNLWRPVEDGQGSLNFLITISATTRGDSPSNLSNWEEELDQKKPQWVKQYVH